MHSVSLYCLGVGESKASLCFALRRILVLWWGVEGEPYLTRADRGGVGEAKANPDLQAIFINLPQFNRTPLSQINNVEAMEELSRDASRSRTRCDLLLTWSCEIRWGTADNLAEVCHTAAVWNTASCKRRTAIVLARLIHIQIRPSYEILGWLGYFL